MNSKADAYEQCVKAFLDNILNLAQIDDTVTFERSYINNTTEMVELLLQCAVYLPKDYVVEKIVNLLGDGDKSKDIIEQLTKDDLMIEE